MNKPQALILLRGLPGAGKTTFAQLISENGKYPAFSIDDYFTQAETGEYSFDYRQNHLAYETCLSNAKKALLACVEKVIVHNPFVLDFELMPYLEMAELLKVQVFVLTVENYHEQTNVHAIPESSIQKMKEKYKVRLM